MDIPDVTCRISVLFRIFSTSVLQLKDFTAAVLHSVMSLLEVKESKNQLIITLELFVCSAGMLWDCKIDFTDLKHVVTFFFSGYFSLGSPPSTKTNALPLSQCLSTWLAHCLNEKFSKLEPFPQMKGKKSILPDRIE